MMVESNKGYLEWLGVIHHKSSGGGTSSFCCFFAVAAPARCRPTRKMLKLYPLHADVVMPNPVHIRVRPGVPLAYRPGLY